MQDADEAATIRDAACVVLVDHAGAEPRLLMGKRHADQVFLPSKWVFPGGRVDDADRNAGAFLDLPHWLHAFGRAAVRELAEETGIVWVGSLQPLARAITPPSRVRRFDTWFFLAETRGDPADRTGGDGELLDLGWFSIDEARRLDLPNITRLVLDDAASLLCATEKIERWRTPFYFHGAAGFARTLIDCRASAPPP